MEEVVAPSCRRRFHVDARAYHLHVDTQLDQPQQALDEVDG
jgi:hypothetical protein